MHRGQPGVTSARIRAASSDTVLYTRTILRATLRSCALKRFLFLADDNATSAYVETAYSSLLASTVSSSYRLATLGPPTLSIILPIALVVPTVIFAAQPSPEAHAMRRHPLGYLLESRVHRLLEELSRPRNSLSNIFPVVPNILKGL